MDQSSSHSPSSPARFASGLVPVKRQAHAPNMDGRALVGGNPATVLSGLLEFSLHSASTCLSQDADQLCVSAGLGFLSALSLLLSFFLWVSGSSSASAKLKKYIYLYRGLDCKCFQVGVWEVQLSEGESGGDKRLPLQPAGEPVRRCGGRSGRPAPYSGDAFTFTHWA